MNLADPWKIFADAFCQAIKPAPIVTVSEWADQNRMLPQKTSSEPGKWRTERTPYLKEIMDELSHMSTTKEIVFMKGAQVGGTEAGNNWTGYVIDYMPSTMMIVWPALPDVKKNSTLRIDPLLEYTPALKDKIFNNVSSDKKRKNTALFKDFDGGALILTGANSASGLRSVPARYLFLDEVDGYPDDVEGEGCPIKLVEARTRTFSKRKIFKCSTPTIKGKSKIESEFIKSDQRFFHVPCPHCKQKQKLEFKNLEYNTKASEGGDLVNYAAYFCQHCGEEIQEQHKTSMLTNGEWIKENPESDTAGFHLSALYSPLGWMSWKEVCQDWVDAQGNHELLTTFNNTVLGLTYEATGDKPEHEALYNRREQYDIGTIPKGVIFLTCAVDVQKDRLEAEVVGWGRNKERWSIDHNVIHGDVQNDETWNQLEQYMGISFPHDDGYEVSIKMVGIDSGYETSRVYSFCRKFSARRVVPLKGEMSLTQIVGLAKAVDVKESGKTNRRGLKLWRVGTNMCKSEIYGDLKKPEPLDHLESYPAGFIHFPQYEMEYFLQLTAEERTIEKDKRGYSKVTWKKKRDRNEILDLHVYNRALASIIGIDRMKESDWQKLEMNIGIVNKIEKRDNGSKSDRSQKRNKRKRESSWL
jgi:phage terminase large subunit GpA-like protein